MSLRSKSSGGSVLATQEPVHRLQHQIHLLKERLSKMEERLQKVIEVHREQIRTSLTSSDQVERASAESVAVFWEVSPPPAP